MDQAPTESTVGAHGGKAPEAEQEQCFDAAQAGIWRWNVARDEGSVDESWCRQQQLDPCIGARHSERWCSQMHPDDAADYRARLATLRDGADAYFEAEYRLLTLENHWLWILQRGRVVARTADGRPQRVIGICIEIDQRKRDETASKANETRLATALWGARAAFWQWHLPTDLRTMSPMWYAMTRYTREQWDGQPNPWASRIRSEDCPGIEAAVRSYRAGLSDTLEYEYRLRTAGGEWKWLLDRARAVEWDLDGNPTLIMGVSLDIDAQKRAETALRSSEARLQTAVWGARIGLWETDLRQDVTCWFDQWCQEFDLDPCEGAGHTERWRTRMHPDDIAGALQRLAEHLAGRADYYDAEYRVRTRGGAWRWIYVRGRVIERDAQRQPLRLVGVCMDIDARRRGAEPS
jgi:PAS domain S-box-containing protein